MSTKTAPKMPKTTKQETQIQTLSTPEISVSGTLIDVEMMGYCPFRADVVVPRDARLAVKRLAMTLDATGATLADGTVVKNSIPKSIAWLLEQFASSVQNS